MTDSETRSGCPQQHQLNVLGTPLRTCGTEPRTGYNRDGMCSNMASDRGQHTVCAKMTEAFLDFSKTRGNDLTSPNEVYGFPGLKPGNRWCLCAMRWKEAYDAGVAPPVFLQCTNIAALKLIPLEALIKYALDAPADVSADVSADAMSA